jgi:hypothetical protein
MPEAGPSAFFDFLCNDALTGIGKRSESTRFFEFIRFGEAPA